MSLNGLGVGKFERSLRKLKSSQGERERERESREFMTC